MKVSSELTSRAVLVKGRRMGWPDSQMALVARVSEETIRRTRTDLGREIAWASLWRLYKKFYVDVESW